MSAEQVRAQRATNEVAQLLGSDTAEGDDFGWSVAVQGDVAVVGAYGNDNANGWRAGAAYIFRFIDGAWAEEVKLLASDGEESDNFGIGVAISGDFVLIGAHNNGANGIQAGAAYMFQYDGSVWNEVAKLFPADAAAHDNFGRYLAVDGELALIASHHDDDNGSKSGSAYVFRHSQGVWVEEQKLLASDGAEDDCFGTAVDLDGDAIVIGAQFDDDYGNNTGAVYTFRFDGSTWIEEAKLFASDAPDAAYFGAAVAVDQDTILAGTGWAYNDDDIGTGATYVMRFDGTSWKHEAKLTPADGDHGQGFGMAITLAEDVAAIGSDYDQDNGEESGSAYVFKRDGSEWTEYGKLLPSDGGPDHRFGCSVGLSGDRLLVGAYGHDSLGDNSGRAYVFAAPEFADCNDNGVDDSIDIVNLTSWDCNHNGIPDECDIADGFSEDLNGDGVPDECLPDGYGFTSLLQNRSVYAEARASGDPEEAFVQTVGFEDFDELLEIYHGGTGIAGQQSSLDPTQVSAIGTTYAYGWDGHYEWSPGWGESVFEVTIGAPADMTVTLAGNIETAFDGQTDWTDVTSRVAFLDSAQQQIFLAELSEEAGATPFNETIPLAGGETYTIEAYAYSHASADLQQWSSCSADFSLLVTPLAPCPEDVNGDEVVNIDDLFQVLSVWGICDDCPEDITNDNVVNIDDVFAVLAAWGPC